MSEQMTDEQMTTLHLLIQAVREARKQHSDYLFRASAGTAMTVLGQVRTLELTVETTEFMLTSWLLEHAALFAPEAAKE